jgi:RNA polymerase sigma-70 factor (ECF subfamily)
VPTGEPLELYRDATFARRMAAGLVGESAADDVWQEAWQTLLTHPPKPGWNVRGYLWTVVRRLALRHRRAEARRTGRERRVARAERLPSSVELIERMEVHRGVVEALLTLEEPYRQTLLLIYFEGLEPREIARRQGIPIETVRTRKKRALAQLRERLQSEHGARQEWLAGLVALARPRAPRAPLLVPAAATLALLAGGLLWWTARSVADSRAVAPSAQPAALVPDVRAEAPVALERTRVADVPMSAPVSVEPLPRARVLHGRVEDESGAPIAEAEVTARLAGLFRVEHFGATRTGPDGRFTLSLAALSQLDERARFLELDVWAPRHRCERREIPLADIGDDFVASLVLAAGRTLVGRVIDAQGRGVAKAVTAARGLFAGERGTRIAASDPEGNFRLGLEPDFELESLEAWNTAVGWGRVEVAEPLEDAQARILAPDLVLHEGGVVRGRVFYADGKPAQDIWVIAQRVDDERIPRPRAGLIQTSTFADGDGRFQIVGLEPGTYSLNSARTPQHTEAARAIVETNGAEVTLVVELRRILLEVTDPTGRPIEDVAVVCTPLQPMAGSRARPMGMSLRSMTRGPSARASFSGLASGRYGLTVLLPGWAKELEVEVGERDYETLRQVALAPEAARGGLSLRAPRASSAGIELRLRTPMARFALDRTWRSDENGFVRDLPVGTFRVEARLPESASEPWQRVREFEVAIPAHGTLEVPLECERGGELALSFSIQGDPPAPKPSRAPASSLWLGLTTWANWQTDPSPATLIGLEDERGARAYLTLDNARPGATWTSPQPLRAGRYRLDTNFEGYRSTRQWFEVTPGATNTFVVALEPTAEGD